MATSQEYRFSRPVTLSTNGSVCFVKLVPVEKEDEEDYDDEYDYEDDDEEELTKNDNQTRNQKSTPIKSLKESIPLLDLVEDVGEDIEEFKMSDSNRKGRTYINMIRRKRQDSLSFDDSSDGSPSSDSTDLMTSPSSSTKRKQKIKISRALELVEAFGLQTCVARTICELSCNHAAFGKTGRSLYNLMTRLNSHTNIPGVEEEKAGFYREAVSSGEIIRDNEDDCKDECNDRYAPCSRPTSFMLRMASGIDFSI
jgi:hypothetical protein